MRGDGSQWDHIFVLVVRRDNRKAMATSLFASHCLMGCNNQAVASDCPMSKSWPHVLYRFRMQKYMGGGETVSPLSVDNRSAWQFWKDNPNKVRGFIRALL